MTPDTATNDTDAPHDEYGEPVLATTRDGETMLGVSDGPTGETAAEYTIATDGSPRTLLTMWDGDVAGDEAVYRVRPARVTIEGVYLPTGQPYAWPESKLNFFRREGGESDE